MDTKTFWNEIGFKKNFNDLFFTDELISHLKKEDQIVEYGCGYGRILNILWEKGYRNLIGFDLSPKMLERGKKEHPNLDLRLLTESAKIDFPNLTADAAILCTVLCSIYKFEEQADVFNEMRRILKTGGYLYICDFQITESDYYYEKYDKYASKDSKEYGIYKSQDTLVRHHSLPYLIERLKGFEVIWKTTIDTVNVNNHPVKAFHLIAKKI